MKTILLLGMAFIFVSCGNPVKVLKKEIESHGYILYQTPLAKAGPGTLVGGRPSMLALVAHPQTCFPDKIRGVKTHLRKYDEANLPSRYTSFEVKGGVNLDLMDFLSTGQGVINAGVKFNSVKKVQIEFSGVTIEYLDTIQLKRFYDHHMGVHCKDVLEKIGFIIQALKVEKMSFKFEKKGGGFIDLKAEGIKDILDVGADVRWSIHDKYTLEIDSPKYVGYQLGRLQEKDNGYALYRSNYVKFDEFVFEDLDIFGGPRRPTSVILGLPHHHVNYEDIKWEQVPLN